MTEKTEKKINILKLKQISQGPLTWFLSVRWNIVETNLLFKS